MSTPASPRGASLYSRAAQRARDKSVAALWLKAIGWVITSVFGVAAGLTSGDVLSGVGGALAMGATISILYFFVRFFIEIEAIAKEDEAAAAGAAREEIRSTFTVLLEVEECVISPTTIQGRLFALNRASGVGVSLRFDLTVDDESGRTWKWIQIKNGLLPHLQLEPGKGTDKALPFLFGLPLPLSAEDQAAPPPDESTIRLTVTDEISGRRALLPVPGRLDWKP